MVKLFQTSLVNKKRSLFTNVNNILATGIHRKAKEKMVRERHLGSALANDDGARLGDLVAVNLDAEALALGVAAILGASRPLLVGVLDYERAAAWEADHRGGPRAERRSGEEGGGRRR